MYIQVRVYLLHAYMHGSRNFCQGGGRSEPQLVEKSPDNLLVLNLFYRGVRCLFKETIIFPESKQGGGVKNVRRSNLFQGDGAQLLFSTELVVFQGVPDSLYPLWIRALPMCTCPCLWHLRVTKNEARSKFFKGIGVWVMKKSCRQNYNIYL